MYVKKNFIITNKQTHNKNSNTAKKAKTVKCLDTKHFRKFSLSKPFVKLVRAAHVVYTHPKWESAVFPVKLSSVEPGRYPLVLTLPCFSFFNSKDVRLPVQLQRVMAAEAEATREARAKV